MKIDIQELIRLEKQCEKPSRFNIFQEYIFDEDVKSCSPSFQNSEKRIKLGLTIEESIVLCSYQGRTSEKINTPLSKQNSLNLFESTFCEYLDWSLAKLPVCTGEYVYRDDIGINETAKNWFKINTGSVVNIPRYLSTFSHQVIPHEGKIFWKIKTLTLNSKGRKFYLFDNKGKE